MVIVNIIIIHVSWPKMDRGLRINDWGDNTHEPSDENYFPSHLNPIQSMNPPVNVNDRCVFTIHITHIRVSHVTFQMDSWPLGIVNHPIVFFFIQFYCIFPIFSFNEESFCRVATPSTYIYICFHHDHHHFHGLFFFSQYIFAASKYSSDTFYDNIPKLLFIYRGQDTSSACKKATKSGKLLNILWFWWLQIVEKLQFTCPTHTLSHPIKLSVRESTDGKWWIINYYFMIIIQWKCSYTMAP